MLCVCARSIPTVSFIPLSGDFSLNPLGVDKTPSCTGKAASTSDTQQFQGCKNGDTYVNWYWVVSFRTAEVIVFLGEDFNDTG